MLNLADALRWDMMADGIQVLMCGLILACMVHNMLRHKRRQPEASPRPAHPAFSQEVLLQSLRQQTEQALASIRATLDAEEAKLQKVLGAAGVPRAAAALTPVEVAAEHTPFRLGGAEPGGTGSLSGRYAGLGELAAQGLSVRQLAAQTRLPAGEIELALKLQRATADTGAAAATRQ